MSNLLLWLEYWLPVVVWMGIIFSASGDSLSFQHSSRIIGPILHWLLPHLSAEATHAAIVFIRKCAHLTEYGVLALLVWRALRKPMRKDPRPWRWREAGQAMLIVLLYASSDEFHQHFVPSREGSVADVLIDTSGALVTLLLLWAIGRGCRFWPPMD